MHNKKFLCCDGTYTMGSRIAVTERFAFTAIPVL